MEIQTPKFLGDATDGMLIDLARQTMDKSNPDRPVVVDYKIRGIVSNFRRVQDATRPYITCDLTDADGTVHKIKSGTNAHIWIITYDGSYDQSLDQSDWGTFEVAATIGDPTSSTWGKPHNRGFICKADQSETDVIVARFEKSDLDVDEKCQRCGKNVSPYGTRADFPDVTTGYRVTTKSGTTGTVLDAGVAGLDVNWDFMSDDSVADYSWNDAAGYDFTFTAPTKN